MELPENRKTSLGTNPEPEAAAECLFCPWCGRQIQADSVYCEFCGKYVPDSPESEKKKRIPPRWLWAGAAVLLLLGAVVWLTGKRDTPAKETLFYIKDNSVYESGGSGAAKEMVSGYLEDWNVRSSGGLLSGQTNEASGKVAPSYSASGRYLFSLERGVKGSFDLVRTDLKKQETKTLDSGVVEFLPAKDGQVVYKKEKGALYCFDHTRKTKLAESVDYYMLNEAGDRLLWATKEEGTNDIYLSGISEKDEKLRLERNAVLLDATLDFSVFLIKKEDTVFKIDRNGKKEKLVEEAENAMQADAQAVSFYYTKTAGLSSGESYTELYYYSGGDSKLLDDSFGQIRWQDEGLLLFTRTDDNKNTMLAADGAVFELGVETVLEEQIGIKGGQLYLLSPGEPDSQTGRPEYDLCAVNLLGNDLGRVRTIDGGVSEIACITNENSYYYKDASDGIADLYCEGEQIAYDVAAGSVAEIPSGGTILCIADAGSEGKRGTLTLVDSGKTEAIADHIMAYSAVSENEIYMLSDYNRSKGRGDLLFYNGSGTATLEADIWGYFETGSSGICR